MLIKEAGEKTDRIKTRERESQPSFEAAPTRTNHRGAEKLREKNKEMLGVLKNLRTTLAQAEPLVNISRLLTQEIDFSYQEREPAVRATSPEDLLRSLEELKTELDTCSPPLEQDLRWFEEGLRSLQSGRLSEMAISDLLKEAQVIRDRAKAALRASSEARRKLKAFIGEEMEKAGYKATVEPQMAMEELREIINEPKKGWREKVFSTPERKTAQRKKKAVEKIIDLEKRARIGTHYTAAISEAAADLSVAARLGAQRALEACEVADRAVGKLISPSLADKVKIAASLPEIEEVVEGLDRSKATLLFAKNNLLDQPIAFGAFGSGDFHDRREPVPNAPSLTEITQRAQRIIGKITDRTGFAKLAETEESLIRDLYNGELNFEKFASDEKNQIEVGDGDAELGAARIEAATRNMGLEVFRRAITHGHDLKPQEALLTFKHPDVAPYAILNCFQNKASGWKLLIGQGENEDPWSSPLLKFISSLTDEERMGISHRNIPGLSSLMSLILENPDTYSLRYIDKNSSTTNPVYQKVCLEVNRAALYLLQSSLEAKSEVPTWQRASEQKLGENLLTYSHYLDPETLGVMERIAQKGEFKGGLGAVAMILAQQSSEPACAASLFRIYPLLTQEERKAVESGGHIRLHPFFDALLESSIDLLSEDALPLLASIFDEEPPETLKSCIKGIKKLKERGVAHRDGLVHAALYASIGGTPALADGIVELSTKYGFVFDPNNALPVVEALATRKEQFIADIETIRLVFPLFTIRNLQRPANPYLDLAQDFNEARLLFLKNARASTNPAIQKAAATIIENIRIPLYAKTAPGNNLDLITSKMIFEATGAPFDPEDPRLRSIILPSLKKRPFSDLVQSKLLDTWAEILRDANAQPVEVPGRHLPELIQRLEGLQSRVANEEYDPWRTELNPLIANALEEKIISLDSVADGEALYSFVQEYGMHNTKLLFRFHVELSRAASAADLKPETRAQLQETLSISLENVPPGELFERVTAELKKFRRKIQSDLLADVVSKEMRTDLGIDIFNTIKSSPSKWAKQGHEKKIIDQWVATLEAHPELGQLPEGYKELTLRVAEVAPVDLTDPGAAQEQLKKQEKILANPDVLRVVDQFYRAFKEAPREIKDLPAWWNEKATLLSSEIKQEIDVLDQRRAAAKNPKAADSMRAQQEKLNTGLVTISAMEVPNFNAEKALAWDTELISFMNRVASAIPEQVKTREHILRVLSAMHQKIVLATSTDGVGIVLENAIAQTNPEYPLNANAVRSWEGHFTDYLKEHYLNNNQANHEVTKHAEIPPELLKTLQLAWGTRIKSEEHPLVQAKRKIDDLSSGEKTGKKTEISLVPSKGLLRIYGGDIGDACYASRHDELASGAYEKLTEFSFVTGRGTEKERLRGSVLVIETTTAAGEKAMVIRANNPQEGLLRQIDGEGLVMETIKGLQSIAEARGIKIVTVPLDEATQSCSNRATVAKVYKNKFTGRDGIMLTDEPETNFNGYEIWDSTKKHKVVAV